MKKLWLCAAILFAAFSAIAAVPTGDLLEGVRPGPDGRIDVITIFPHPDDEVAYSGGTLIKMKSDPRVRVHILCMTLGDLSPAKDTLEISPEKMAMIRSEELKAVGAVIKADEVIQWDYHDQGLEKADQKELYERILDAINKTDAEVIIGYGPEGITGHTDHVVGYKLTQEAFKNSKAQKLYYVNVPRILYPIYRSYSKIDPLPATVKVDIRCCRKMKLLALDEHASQKFFIGPIEKLEFSVIFNYEYYTLGGSK